LQFDAVAGAYLGHPKSITTTGSGLWRTVRFEIADGFFGNRQNNGADFRVTALSGRVHIRRVWVRRPTAFSLLNGPASDLASNSCTVAGTLLQDAYAEPWARVLVYWGTQDGGTVKGNWEHSVLLGTNSHRGSTVFSGLLTGLTMSGSNYYRFYASNGLGEAWADSPALVPVERLQAAVTLLPAGATWRYFDQTNDLGTTWRSNGFNDASWASGPAFLGFGDANGLLPVTLIGSNRQWTTYFRRTFWVPDASKILALSARLLRDDGAVIYLNGAEVWRDPNMPSGTITNTTPALSNVTGAAESTWLTNSLNPAGLITGTNFIAAEVHQNTSASSDLSFDFELVAVANVPSQPRLGAAQSGLVWDGNAVLYSLFTTTNLTDMSLWTRATNLPVFSNGVWQMGWPSGEQGSRFYRLQAQ
jgi:hypothetical protein